MWRNGLRVGAMVAVLAACHDARLVAPDLDGAAGRLRGAEAVRFPCAWSVRSEGGPHRYRYGRAAVAVPRAALAPDGATTEYRYVVQAPGADPVYVARCVVPATRAAVEHLDRRFGVVRATAASTTGDAVAQGCVSDGECILEPITVQPCAGPAPGPTESAPDCGGGGGGGDPGWWTGGGPYEPPPDDGGTTGGGGGGGGGGGDDPGGDDPYPPEPCDTGDPIVDSPEVPADVRLLADSTDSLVCSQLKAMAPAPAQGRYITTDTYFRADAFYLVVRIKEAADGSMLMTWSPLLIFKRQLKDWQFVEAIAM